jgi:hypothetical protein
MLSGERFGDYLNDPARTVLKAVADGQIVGYAKRGFRTVGTRTITVGTTLCHYYVMQQAL